jgi:hypothetical protein
MNPDIKQVEFLDEEQNEYLKRWFSENGYPQGKHSTTKDWYRDKTTRSQVAPTVSTIVQSPLGEFCVNWKINGFGDSSWIKAAWLNGAAWLAKSG